VLRYSTGHFQSLPINSSFAWESCHKKKGLSPLVFIAEKKHTVNQENFSWQTRFHLMPFCSKTCGNIIGGDIKVGMIYWFVYIGKIDD